MLNKICFLVMGLMQLIFIFNLFLLYQTYAIYLPDNLPPPFNLLFLPKVIRNTVTGIASPSAQLGIKQKMPCLRHFLFLLCLIDYIISISILYPFSILLFQLENHRKPSVSCRKALAYLYFLPSAYSFPPLPWN